MKLTEKQVLKLRGLADIEVEILPEEASIRGNCLASGDDAEDEACALEIERQLEAGNDLAWCTIKVSAKYSGFEGVDYLGCCSYPSLKAFKEDGYYVDMVAQAFDALVLDIESSGTHLKNVLEALA